MIKLKNIYRKNEIVIEPTAFPDGTSQVWKLPGGVLEYLGKYHITWFFESEAEIMTLIQLKYLLVVNGGQIQTMFIPFLPYARQDKGIHNECTFALKPFLDLLLDTFAGTSISTLDVHNKEAFQLKNSIDSLSPTKHILKSLVDCQADLICYPDEGAKDRYAHLVPYDHVIAEKVRDQASGQITGHKLLDTGKISSQDMIQGKVVLLVDDICDGGKTFTSAAKMLKEAGAKAVHLYVTHGIFSQGAGVLTLGGIDKVYTTNSYVNSKTNALVTQYKVEE